MNKRERNCGAKVFILCYGHLPSFKSNGELNQRHVSAKQWNHDATRSTIKATPPTLLACWIQRPQKATGDHRCLSKCAPTRCPYLPLDSAGHSPMTPPPPCFSIGSGGSSLPGSWCSIEVTIYFSLLLNNKTAMPPSQGDQAESSRGIPPILCEYNTPLMPVSYLGA